MCYFIRTLGLEELVSTNDRTIIKGTDPKLGLSLLRSNSSYKLILIYFKIKIFLFDFFKLI